jgi:hypothetical protein
MTVADKIIKLDASMLSLEKPVPTPYSPRKATKLLDRLPDLA